MAKIKLGAIVADISGSVHGNVFSRNASGNYVKGFTMPHNANTTKQQNVRSKFATNVALWKGLSQADQQAWIDIASQYPKTDSLGQSGVYTGPQLFNKLNQTLSVFNLPAISRPLVPKAFTAMLVEDFELIKTAGVLTTAGFVISSTGSADESLIVTITQGLSNGINRPGKNKFRIVKTVNDITVNDSVDIVSEYVSLYGQPELGTKVFLRVDLVNTSTGQRLKLGQVTAQVTGT